MKASTVCLFVLCFVGQQRRSGLVTGSRLSSLIATDEFYRHANHEAHSRVHNLDYYPSPNISICNVVDMNVHSIINDDGVRLAFLQPFAKQAVASIALAMEHLNSGNGSVIPEVAGLNETCGIRFVPEFFDTAGKAREIVGPLIKVLDREQHRPCAFTGALWSEVTVPTAILTGVSGFPQMSALSVAPELDDKRRFPLFGRVRPVSEDAGPIALDFVYHQYTVRHLGVFHETNDLSLSYLRSLQRAVSREFPDLKLYPVGFNGQLDEKGNLVELPARITLLKKLDLRFFFLIGRNGFYNAIFEEAHRQGIAGTGMHNWISVENDSTWEVQAFLPTSPILRSVGGLTAISSIGSRDGVGRFEYFKKAWQDLGNQATDLAFLESKLPAYDDEEMDYSTRMDSSIFEEVNEFFPLFYDLMILMGLAACSVGHEQLTGSAHFEAILRTSFVGVTGPLALKPSTGSRDPKKTLYRAVNYVPRVNAKGNVSLVPVNFANYEEGEWHVTSQPVFNDNTTTIPPDLKPVTVKIDNIGAGLRRLGHFFSGVVMTTSACMALWTFVNQKSRVIRASQPFFLHLICFGSFLMGLSIIPLTIDDTVTADPSGACFGYPSLVMLGWCFAFTALFSKSRQVNRVFHKPSYSRVVIRRSDVFRPMSLLVFVNSAILVTWFVVSPHQWKRTTMKYDTFSRPLETSGRCESEHGREFWISILVVNILVLLFAMQQAFVARKIATEFSESEYIERAMSIIFVVAIVACPVMLLAKDDPRSLFFVKAVLAFAVSMSLLMFMFVPKIIYFRHHGSKNYVAAVRQTLSRLQQTPAPESFHVEEESTELFGTRVTDHPKLHRRREGYSTNEPGNERVIPQRFSVEESA